MLVSLNNPFITTLKTHTHTHTEHFRVMLAIVDKTGFHRGSWGILEMNFEPHWIQMWPGTKDNEV